MRHKPTKREGRLIEPLKTVFIGFLTATAVLLLLQTPLPGMLAEQGSPTGQLGHALGDSLEQVQPVSMAVVVEREGTVVKQGVLYDDRALDESFRSLSLLLREAMGSLPEHAPRTVSQAQWQAALVSAPGIHVKLAGEIPLPILVGWFSGRTDLQSDAASAQLVLTVLDGEVTVLYADEETGAYYAHSVASEITPGRLAEGVAHYEGNEVYYGFELPQFEGLWPDTFILSQLPQLYQYEGENLLSDVQQESEVRAYLFQALNFPMTQGSFYYIGEELVLMNGSDELRLRPYRLSYTAGERSRYPIGDRGENPLYHQVEQCRLIVAKTIGVLCGDARVHVSSIQQEENRTVVEFTYYLNGIPLQYSNGTHAAQFSLENGEIKSFNLNLRAYHQSGEVSPVLPLHQTIAAIGAMEQEQGELMLMYRDTTARTVQVGWVLKRHDG